jgi:hypothetical protein
VSNIEFVWDLRKAKSNASKHGVSFEEAQSVFLDESARLIDDPDHSADEERFVLLGYSFRARCLPVIRLISARQATPHEEAMYWSFK